MSTDHSAAGDVDCHLAASKVDVAGSRCDSIDWVVPSTSIRNHAEDWYADEYCFQRPIPEASSSWPLYLCAYCQ